ncbi:MAG: FitA-like ribbon-helix-helix domain-containing protein [Actinomycetaceae bacterium]
MEQILIRNLPVGTKASLRARAKQNQRSLEAEARALLAAAAQQQPPTIVDLVSVEDGVEIEFEPEQLGMRARTPEL